jgi:hypothetical protein
MWPAGETRHGISRRCSNNIAIANVFIPEAAHAAIRNPRRLPTKSGWPFLEALLGLVLQIASRPGYDARRCGPSVKQQNVERFVICS